MGIVEALLVLPMAAFSLAIVARCIGTDQYVSDAKSGRCQFQAYRQIPFAFGETVGKFRAIVRLYTFDCHTAVFDHATIFSRKSAEEYVLCSG